MLNKEQLREKIANYNSFLQKPVNDDAKLLERLDLLGVLIAQSGEHLADAKYWQDELINGETTDLLKRKLEESLSATTINLYIKSAAKEVNHLVNSLDRINRAAVHQLDAIRTRISFIKNTYN